jgi:hypothetical protein
VAGTTISPFGNPERPRRPGFGSASPVPDAPHISSSFYRRSRLVATGAAAAGTHAVRKKGGKKEAMRGGTGTGRWYTKERNRRLFYFSSWHPMRHARVARREKAARACNARASAQETGREKARALAMPGPVHKRQGGGYPPHRRRRVACTAVEELEGGGEAGRRVRAQGKAAPGASACECSSLVLVSGSPARQPLGEPQITSHTAARV